jgi:peptide/nickel transport system substrate-binding protein
LSLIAAACGSDDDDTGGPTTTAAGPGTTAAPGETTTSGAPPSDAAMTLTIQINPDAVWDDGTPITVADFQCNWNAILNTPGSLSTVGYDKITSIEEGADDHEVVISFSEKYAPYKNLFSAIFPAHSVEDCNDVSADFQTELPFSGREWIIESWSPEQLILVPNEAYWNADRTPIASRVVMVPKADSDTEIASIKSGEVAFIFPQAFSGINDALADANIDFTPGYGTNYEGLYFQQDPAKGGPFSDADFRKAFSMSVDRDKILASIYEPIFPGAPLLNCGVWVPTIGDWCDQTIFENSYDPAAAETLLTDAGWVKDGNGMWTKDGAAPPTIRWIINTGNTRRENTQALMIPDLVAKGFNVVADNCDAACYFQQRLPALDYDLAMYITTAAPDPTATASFHCDQVPSEANANQGQNSTGWCNEEASDLMIQSDQELDEATRVDQIHQIAQFMADDAVMLPLYQFPNIAAWRTDQLSGPIDADAANYRAFGNNLYQWEPTSGDEIIIGAEQWPECLNPITECANSSWYVWTTLFLVAPGVFDTTADGNYVATDLVVGEPTVEVAG